MYISSWYEINLFSGKTHFFCVASSMQSNPLTKPAIDLLNQGYNATTVAKKLNVTRGRVLTAIQNHVDFLPKTIKTKIEDMLRNKRRQNGKNTKYLKEWRKKQSLETYYVLKQKLKNFCKGGKLIAAQDVIDKFGPNPVCYLTGIPVSYDDATTYCLDHVIPIACGGSPEIHNLDLINPVASKMKNVITKKEFVGICKLVAERYK